MYPDLTAVFLSVDTKVTDHGLELFRRRSPGVRLLSLGKQAARADVIALLLQPRGQDPDCREPCLNLTSRAYQRVNDDGLKELVEAMDPLLADLPEHRCRAQLAEQLR
eukprot:COSAG04_NODE_736_length_10705_cov_17.817273_2_plen_108_part_00